MGIPLKRQSECAHAIINTSSSGAVSIVAGTAGQLARIYRMILTAAGATTVTVQDTGPNALSQGFAFGASGGSITIDIPINGDPWWQATAQGLGLQFNNSAAVAIGADVWYLVAP